VETPIATNAITHILHFTIIARKLMAENSLRNLYTMEKISRVPPRTEEGRA
jgi:hypothetical protein